MEELFRQWKDRHDRCRGLRPPRDRGTVLESFVDSAAVDRELYVLPGAELTGDLVAETFTAPRPTRLVVTTPDPDAARARLAAYGLAVYDETTTLMTTDLAGHPPAPPTEYAVREVPDGPLVQVWIGEGAARGIMASVGGQAVFHYVWTDPAYRRRGLSRIVMGTLAARARDREATTGILAATPAGLPLYTGLGWTRHDLTLVTATAPRHRTGGLYGQLP